MAPGRASPSPRARPVNFARDVRSILSDNCFACHGPDDKTRKAGPAAGHQGGACWRSSKSGEPRGRPRQARRERAGLPDRDRRPRSCKMPPKKFGKQLTAEQIDMLRRWVEQGATWTTHWAFEPPRKADAARRQGRGLARQSDRPVHPGPARGRGAHALARGRPDDARSAASPST